MVGMHLFRCVPAFVFVKVTVMSRKPYLYDA